MKITETYDSAYRRGKSAANPPYICDPRLSHSAQVSTGIQAVEAAFAKGDMDVLLERFKKKLLFTDFLFQPIDEHCYFDIPDNTQKLPDISTGRMLLNFLETKKAALRDKRVHPSIGEKTTSAFSEFVNVLGKIIERSWIKHLLKHQKIKWIPEEKWNRVTSSD